MGLCMDLEGPGGAWNWVAQLFLSVKPLVVYMASQYISVLTHKVQTVYVYTCTNSVCIYIYKQCVCIYIYKQCVYIYTLYKHYMYV